MRLTYFERGLLVALAFLVGCSGGAPSNASDESDCVSVGERSSIGDILVNWSARRGWTESPIVGDETPWAVGAGTMQIAQFVPCGMRGQRPAKPAPLETFSVTFDPPSLARVTSLHVGDAPSLQRTIVVDVDAIEPGDGSVTVQGQFEGPASSVTRSFHVRRFEDVSVPIGILGIAQADPLPTVVAATLRDGLWTGDGAASAAHEPLIVQEEVQLPWSRADGRLEVARAQNLGSLRTEGYPQTFAALTFPQTGLATIGFVDSRVAMVDVVDPFEIASGDLLDMQGTPIRMLTCPEQREVDIKVALTDEQGRSVTGGGVLVRSFDLDKARPYADGDSVHIDCLVPGETTLELVAGQRLEVALTITPLPFN